MPFDRRSSASGFSLMLVIASGLFSMPIHAAENLYAKNYKAQSSAQLRSLQQNPDTKIFVSNHKEEDNISMLEKGYDMMGSSGFEAGNVPADLALQHGKNIHADTVLVYTKYGSSKTAESKMQAIKDAIKNKGEVTEQDLPEDPTVYQYYASYWAKLPTPLLGVHIIKLKQKADPTQAEEAAQDEAGLKVIAVVQDSPAAKAAIKRGDMLLKLNNTKLDKAEDLAKVVRQYQGKQVEIEYERNGEKAIAQAQINTRN